MASLSDIVFTPALGTSLAVSPDSSVANLYAASLEPVDLVAKLENGGTQGFERTASPSVGGLLTYKATVPASQLPTSVTVYTKDGRPIPGANSLTITASRPGIADRDFSTCISLAAGEDNKSTRLDWLDQSAWQGWAWQRTRPTWIETNFVSSMADLASDQAVYCLLLHPSGTDEGKEHTPDEVLAVFPASSRSAFVMLTGPRDQEAPGVYARTRRVGAIGEEVHVYVTGRLTAAASGEKTAISGAIRVARQKYGLPPASFEMTPGTSPFDRLGFCTWSSIGEHVLLNKANMTKLVQNLSKDAADVPVETFIIDDGWQDIRHRLNGDPKSRGLWSFGTWDGMGCNLAELVSLVKSELPLVKDVGVWMTLAGYWNSVAPGSPLDEKYKMKRYPLNRNNVPGQWPPAIVPENLQSGLIEGREGPCYVLPPPDQAAAFWKDCFETYAAAGVTFVKVDNQAYGSFLDGVDGGQEFVAMWDAMLAAANAAFGRNRVIHCMAHYERTFSGDIGMGIPSDNQKIVIRNSDDFGLNRDNVHRDHIHHNLYNAMLLESQALIQDVDMFMTAAQWPVYHAILRVFAPGPILLADHPGEWDVAVVKKLMGKTTRGEWRLVRSADTATPLARNVWERTRDGGVGPSIKAASSFGAHGTTIVLWAGRADAAHGTADLLFEGDIVDGLGESREHPSGGRDYALWLGSAEKAIPVTLTTSGTPGKPDKVTVNATSKSDPVLAVSLPPEGVETVTAVPFWRVGGQDIAVAGLVDKYAGLAGIAETRKVGDRLVVDVQLSGTLGLILGAGSAKMEIKVDGKPVEFAREDVGLADGGLSLIKVDLQKIEADAAKDVWTVEIGQAT